MGGYGSGRTANRAKVHYLLSIDVRRWAREGKLSRPCYFGWQWTRNGEKTGSIGVWVHEHRIELQYRKDEEPYRYSVRLESTPCHFGGRRLWFECPSVPCGRRAAILYLGDPYFACRRCYRLAYQSQSETPWNRAERAANKIAARLIEDRHGYLQKPKRMRWKTYNRLIARFRAYDDRSLCGILARIERLTS